LLSYGFPEPAEVCDKFLIVLPGVDIEAVPEVAPDGNASESPFSDLLDVVEADASFGDNLAVYDAASGCSVQFVGREGSLVLVFRYAVEDVSEQDILARRLSLDDALQVVAGAGDGASVGCRSLRMSFAKVNAHQTELVAKIEMVVNDDFTAVLLWNEAQQTLAEYRFRVGLTKVKNVQAFFEESRQNLVFLHEELWASEQNKFHSFSFLRAKLHKNYEGTKLFAS